MNTGYKGKIIIDVGAVDAYYLAKIFRRITTKIVK